MKLWQKEDSIDKLFERFTIGNDPILDLEIAYYDVLGSIAHAKMLGKVGLITEEESSQLVDGLEGIKRTIQEKEFVIEDGIEDCHSQIELLLIRDLGEVGKKVHSGRSRNDQVLTALKLYTKSNLEALAGRVRSLFDVLIAKSEENREILLPGYTHMQIAMPSSFGLWLAAYAESLIDDLIMIKAAHRIADKNPLGSAAGYGSSFPLDRDFTTKEMEFSDLNVNSVYAQMTRGKLERCTAYAISSVAATLSKLAMDVCQYMGQNFGFLSLNEKFTTGSSIMPHKHNPDGFELVRGKCNSLQGLPNEINLILTNLPSGYHRDLQILKDHFIPAINSIDECIVVTTKMVDSLTVNQRSIEDKKYDLIFSVERVNELVQGGVAFRDAYHQVASEIRSGDYQPNYDLNHTHIGSLGNLGNDRIRSAFEEEYRSFK